VKVEVSEAWREVDGYSSNTVRVTTEELRTLGEQLDALIRPLIAAGRKHAPRDAELVHVSVRAFPRTARPWRRPEP
jgi:hypothetical protein